MKTAKRTREREREREGVVALEKWKKYLNLSLSN
jgi:hypothetical protein